MKELKIVNGRLSTLDFAEMTGTEHKHVLAKARKLLKDLDILTAEFSATRIDARGKECELLNLDKDLSLTLAGQYEPKITYHVAKAFKRKPQLTHLEMLSQGFAKMAEIERQQQEQAQINETLTNDVKQIKQALDHVDGNSRYMTALAFCRLHNIPAPLKVARMLGVKCSAQCKSMGVPTGEVPDERWGSTKSYPLDILEEYKP